MATIGHTRIMLSLEALMSAKGNGRAYMQLLPKSEQTRAEYRLSSDGWRT